MYHRFLASNQKVSKLCQVWDHNSEETGAKHKTLLPHSERILFISRACAFETNFIERWHITNKDCATPLC